MSEEDGDLSEPEVIYAASWLERVHRPVRLRLRNAQKQSALVICAAEALCAHSDFFQALLENYEPSEEIDIMVGACELTAATGMLQHLHSIAFLDFKNTTWNAVWADLASRWQVIGLVEHYRSLIKGTVLGHVQQLRDMILHAARLDGLSRDQYSTHFRLPDTTKTALTTYLRQLEGMGSAENVVQLIEMTAFISPFSSYPLYRMDLQVFHAQVTQVEPLSSSS